MVGWHHWLNGYEFEQALGVDDEQGSLMCCRPWVTKSQTRVMDRGGTHTQFRQHAETSYIAIDSQDSLLWLSSVQSLSHVRLCNLMDCSTPGLPVITNSRSLLKLMSTESVMPSSHLILCCLLLLPPSIFPSISIFSNESTLHISIGVSASASVLQMNTQVWSLGWIGWISLQSKGLSRVFSNTTVQNTTVAMTRLRSMNW